jgi:hypothetical protein
MTSPPHRPRRTRLARGSAPPADAGRRDWIAGAVRVRFPKLAAALGDRAFDVMLGAYVKRVAAGEPITSEVGAQLASFLSDAPHYPVWYAELAALDRAHVDVLQAPDAIALPRVELAPDRALRLIDAHALVELTTAVDELWTALDAGLPPASPRELDYPRTVLVWRPSGITVRERTVEPDEALALRAVARGTTLGALARTFCGENPSARALDVVLRWIDAGVLAR